MASGPLVGGSGDGSSRKKHRWAESKVYTRKIHNKNPKNPPQAPSSQTLAQEDTNTSSQHQNSTTRLDVASDDSSNHRQVDQVNRVDVINNHDEVPNENASVSRSDNHLTINLSSSSKQEVRELKKKLVNELEQVRSLLKKLEAEELEVSGVNGYTYSQFLGSDVVENGGLRRMDSVVEENGGVRRLDCEVEENGELRRMEYEVEENGGLRRMDCEAEEIGELRRLDCEVEENGGLRRMDCEVENGGFRRLNSEIEENGVFRRMNSEVEENVELRRMNPEVENGGFRRANFEVGNDGFRRSNSEVGNSGLRRMNSEVEKGGLRRMNSEAVSVCNRGPPRSLQVSVMENGYRHGYGQGGVSGVVEKRTPKVNQYYKNSGFIVGKEKFPPPESNKKSKGSKNHGFGLGIQYSKVFKNCNSLLTKLMKHRYGWVFNKPVDVNGLGLHDYYLIIKHPMDLGTVKSRLNTNWYRSPRDFAEDVRLTFNNAMTYNPKGQDVHIMAEVLSKMFEDDWADMENEYDLDSWFEVEHEVILPMPMARKVPPPPPTVHQEIRRIERLDSLSQTVDCKPKPVNSAPQGRIPALKKPKAKDLNKRDMTFEEKQKLSENLQKLPSEKLDSIVHIIKKRNTSLSQNDDEIEVDIDLVDIETLWELDRFVTNYKKSLSKYKRRAELAQAREAAARYAREMNPTPVQTVVPLETKTDERNVLPSSPMQVERQGDPSSRSSSSSSSSSDSGSSSSDSDSDSSSDSDSGNSPRT